ncbi:MAG: hypothetical protein AAF586_03475 [Planctomycetota bacterium]
MSPRPVRHLPTRPLARLRGVAIALLAATLLAGCSHLDQIERFDVEAEYLGLENKTIAVFVSADEFLLYRHPQVQDKVGRVIAGRLQENLDGARLMHPNQVATYQKDNPYWQTMMYSQLIERVGTDAIVLVDIVNYQLHEPGNRWEKRGSITANVGVIEANAPDADDFTYFNTVSNVFPEDLEYGIIDEEDSAIELGLLTLFSRDAAGLFYDHTVERKR